MKGRMSLFVGVFLNLILMTSVLAAEPTTNQNSPLVAQQLRIEMVDSGYTMGDKLTMKATFELATGEAIDPDSLPLVGRVRPWLDIVKVNLEQSRQEVTLEMVWQLFATVEVAQQLSTPPVVIRTKGPQKQLIKIPAQQFYYSPVLPLPPLKDIKRRKNPTPPAFDTTTPMVLFTGFTVLFGLFAFMLAWLKDALPWLPFRPGPMTRLARLLKPIANQNRALDLVLLKQVHEALNSSAGESLYAQNLTPLMKKAPYFTTVKTQVSQFFQDSWQHFYAPTKAPIIQAATVYAWVKQMAMAERVYRQQRNVSDD